MDKLIDGLLWYIVFLFSITFHEAAHALTALKLGDKTAYEGGQVTMDPIPHIRREPLGTVVVPIISFLLGGWMIGWASTPYDPHWAMRYPKRSALMSLAGPAANLTLVLFAFVLMRLGVIFHIFYAPGSINFSHITAATSPGFFDGIAMIMSILFSLNLILCFFNLLPLPPLDGSGIIPLILDEQTAHKYMDILQSRTFAFIGLIVAWKVFGYVFRPIHLFAINLLYPGVGYH
jgi:Zn-dependent protease